ncbi:helix-turn-helix transcriptional regulator [Kitasatospora sp. NBC_01287]|uniref:helix-turn-helix transcriptional regulator n=1 Tax=Kitasatospora sp. NBC_01287 TaxID=2903573 RepID=UPI00224F9C1B|nr:helix-turn-helix transcriptional regulator [Kitasatospora sp. NBC_01287]MCX4748251.1 helix-turn-helix transcriptional regulator [Kitasatospora sp. NBC_01287]
MENTLGEFLRSRRARIQPEEVGLRSYGQRRVPGLRREEVAQLAGVSVDYYIRLEQGRGANVSDAVLDAVARVLALDEVERAHLRALARPPRAASPTAARTAGARAGQQVCPGLRRLLDAMTEVPAFVLGRRMDVLAWNALGDAVVGFSAMDPGRRNMARQTFLEPDARTYYPQWEAVAAETVSHLRLDAGRHPEDPELASLVGDLSLRSPEFRRLWADHQVREKTWGQKLLRHPLAGDLELGYEALALPGDPDQLLVCYTAVPGSPTAQRLALLASWSAPQPQPQPQPQPESEGRQRSGERS